MTVHTLTPLPRSRSRHSGTQLGLTHTEAKQNCAASRHNRSTSSRVASGLSSVWSMSEARPSEAGQYPVVATTRAAPASASARVSSGPRVPETLNIVRRSRVSASSCPAPCAGAGGGAASRTAAAGAVAGAAGAAEAAGPRLSASRMRCVMRSISVSRSGAPLIACLSAS